MGLSTGKFNNSLLTFMDAKYFKILSFLYEKGVGVLTNISPILLELFPGVDNMDGFTTQNETQNINRLLIGMKNNELIDFEKYKIGSGNNTDGYLWLDTVKINASITQKGKDAVDSELSKGDTARLLESTILTNVSVRETNLSTIKNYNFQKSVQIWTLIIGGLSTVFIFTTIIQSALDNTPQHLKHIETQVKEQSKALRRLDSSLQEIKTSIETKRIDTVFGHPN